MSIIATVNGEHIYTAGKHIDSLRAEDSPYYSESMYMGFRRSTIWAEKTTQRLLTAERTSLGYSQLMNAIYPKGA